MSIIDTILNLAVSQVGTKESPADSNKTVYGVAYGWNGVPWCVIFVWWLFNELKLNKLFFGGSKTASCGAYYKWAVKANQIVTEPKKGDIVIYSFRKTKTGERETSHMGIIDEVDDKYIISVEGNTSTGTKGSQDNGGIVARRKRNKSLVYCYIRPEYVDVEETAEPAKETSEPAKERTYTVVKGDTLYGIAKKFYGCGNKWRLIYDYNNLKSTTIQIGKVLMIPEEV